MYVCKELEAGFKRSSTIRKQQKIKENKLNFYPLNHGIITVKPPQSKIFPSTPLEHQNKFTEIYIPQNLVKP